MKRDSEQMEGLPTKPNFMHFLAGQIVFPGRAAMWRRLGGGEGTPGESAAAKGERTGSHHQGERCQQPPAGCPQARGTI